MNFNDDGKANLMADIGLVAFLTLISFTTLLVDLSGHPIWSFVYLGITMMLLLVTYFYGLIPGLLSNLLFIFSQIVVTAYIHLQLHQPVPLKMSLWLVVPGVLCLTMAVMMGRQQELQLRNRQLRTQLVTQSTLDAQTNLRTMVAFTNDAQVFIENHRQFDLPLTMLVVRVRYFQELEKMLNPEQVQNLRRLVSNLLTRESKANHLTYYLNPKVPTWGMMLHVDQATASKMVVQLKQEFEQQLAQSGQLKSLDTSLVVGLAYWNARNMQSPYDLLNQSIRETEYDV